MVEPVLLLVNGEPFMKRICVQNQEFGAGELSLVTIRRFVHAYAMHWIKILKTYS